MGIDKLASKAQKNLGWVNPAKAGMLAKTTPIWRAFLPFFIRDKPVNQHLSEVGTRIPVNILMVVDLNSLAYIIPFPG